MQHEKGVPYRYLCIYSFNSRRTHRIKMERKYWTDIFYEQLLVKILLRESRYVFHREAAGLFSNEKRLRVCLPSFSLKEVSRRTENVAMPFARDSLFSGEHLDIGPIACTQDEPIDIGFRASFSSTF